MPFVQPTSLTPGLKEGQVLSEPGNGVCVVIVTGLVWKALTTWKLAKL